MTNDNPNDRMAIGSSRENIHWKVTAMVSLSLTSEKNDSFSWTLWSL